MTEPLYEWMTSQQAAAALDAYLAERDPALQRLRSELAAHDVDPDPLLDGTVESVAPVWEWITARAGRLGVDPRPLGEDPTRPSWPSWARHGKLVDPHPPAGSLALVDGFSSYLGQVLTTEVPEARWRTGEHRISDYPAHNHPVIAGAGHEIFPPGIPLYSLYQTAHGRQAMSGAELLAHTRRSISALRGDGPDAAAVEEPPVTVVAEVDCFDVGLRDDIAVRHPETVEWMIAELTDRDGVDSVHRYGPAALVVDAPTWDEVRLKLWCTMWLQRHLPR
jgi:hypothetical protein